MPKAYSLEQFIADLKIIARGGDDEAALLRRMAPLAERLARQPGIIATTAKQPIPENGFVFNLLHEEPDHSLAVAILRWLPTAKTLPHGHGTWGVVVGISGDERNIFWQRTDDGSMPGYAKLKRVGVMQCRIGEAVLLPSAIIHSVENCTDSVSESLHVYGKNIYYTERSHFDVENCRELAWQVKADC